MESRNGVEPSVLPKSSGGAPKCSSRSGPAHTADRGIMWARFECADRRLPDVCVDMTRQAAKPSVDRVHRLGHGRKITALNDFLDEAKLFGRDVGILVPYRDRSCDISLAGIICAEFLKRQVGVGRLVCRIGTCDTRGFVGHT